MYRCSKKEKRTCKTKIINLYKQYLYWHAFVPLDAYIALYIKILLGKIKIGGRVYKVPKIFEIERTTSYIDKKDYL